MIGQELYRIESEKDFLNKVHWIVSRSLDDPPKYYSATGRAHSVVRTFMLWDHGKERKVPYRTILHYNPDCGYWGIIKDNHGTIVLKTEMYCLASTVREVMMEKLYEIRGGDEE